MKKTAVISISRLLSTGAIELNLKSKDRDGVLAELVALVPQIANQRDAQETVLKALHEREALHSTGIGDGIALPHARNGLVGLVDDPVIVFGRHPAGIDFGAIDKLPARLFFLLIAPTVTQHLAVLARVGRSLRDPRVRHGLLSAEKATQVVAIFKESEKEFASNTPFTPPISPQS